MKQTELYENEALEREAAKKKRVGILMLALAGVGLLICVLLCVFTTRQNYHTTLPIVIGVSILFGWSVIFLSHTGFEAARAAIRHREMIGEGERETLTGSFQKTADVRHVRRGVSVRRVKAVRDDGREKMLSIYEALSDRLPETFSGTVTTVYDFIVAYEVNGDV